MMVKLRYCLVSACALQVQCGSTACNVDMAIKRFTHPPKPKKEKRKTRTGFQPLPMRRGGMPESKSLSANQTATSFFLIEFGWLLTVTRQTFDIGRQPLLGGTDTWEHCCSLGRALRVWQGQPLASASVVSETVVRVRRKTKEFSGKSVAEDTFESRHREIQVINSPVLGPQKKQEDKVF